MIKSHLLKYLLISPNLPVGGFCYSEGMESYLHNKDLKDSLTWLKRFGNEDVDLFRDWLIVSNFQVVSDLVDNSLIIDKNELGKIQILKADGEKCDRCWHYQKETFSGIQNTKLCKRCSNIINLECS